jgi:hypothetical protein
MLLFLLGLITGLLEQRFTNVRMGLSAHLEGVMNGILLLALGAAWNEVRLPHRVKVTAYCTALYGTYVNWASDLDSCGSRHRSKFSNHFSRPQRSAMARELCRNGISHRGDLNYRYADTRSLGSSRNGRRGQRYLETFGIQHSQRGGRTQIMSLVTE